MCAMRRRGGFTPSPHFACPSIDEPRTHLPKQTHQGRINHMGQRWSALSEQERTTRIFIAAAVIIVVAWLIITA
jgi:hypothetical protein